MRRTRLFVDMPLSAGDEITLPQEASHHLVGVLRNRVGQTVCLFNNTGVEATATLLSAERRAAVVRIDVLSDSSCESPLSIHLAIGISRGERMDFVLQKSTELGVSCITPLWCDRTEVKLDANRQTKKMQHWQQIIASACEQSGRTRLPVLETPGDSHTFIQNAEAQYRLVLEPGRTRLPFGGLPQPGSIILLVGPEGGLTESEVAAAEAVGYRAWTLGPRILRTETAPLAALSVLQYLWGDFG
jgi:16S rRNA (uracil1498-N3)-methyltransferase